MLDLRDTSFCWTGKGGKVHAQKCKQPGSLQEFLMHLHWPYSQTCVSDPQKSSPHRSYRFLSAYHFLAPNMLCYCCSPAAKPPQKTSFWTLRETALPRFVVPNWNKTTNAFAGIHTPFPLWGLLTSFWTREVVVASLKKPQGTTDALREPSSRIEQQISVSSPRGSAGPTPAGLHSTDWDRDSRGLTSSNGDRCSRRKMRP